MSGDSVSGGSVSGGSSLPPVPPVEGSFPQAASAQPPVPPLPSQSQPSQSQPASPPPPARGKSLLFVWIGVGLVVLLALVAGGLTWITVSAAAARNAPEKIVDAYLAAVVEGRIDDAVALGGGIPDNMLPDLLTDEAYAAAGAHVTGYTIDTVGVDSSGATVVATIEQGANEFSQSFRLTRTGREAIFVDTWALDPIDYSYIRVSFDGPTGSGVTVNGTAIDEPVESITARPLAALPGSYVVGAPSADGKVQIEDDTVTVDSFTADVDGVDATLTASLTPEGEAAGQAAAAGYLDACIAQPVLAPVGCDFYAETGDGEVVTNLVWSVDPRPTFTIGAWTPNGWEVLPDAPGTIIGDGDYSLPSGEFGTVRYTLSNYAYGGYLTLVDGVMTFTFSGSNASGGGGVSS
ncbi:hypothetical protein [Herbiconiux sp. UC225_62]|uniref:hypothetical protein n=1 Tax=Herbiconiux sp. UC225_62 TaxID=3350168 RepID=UPI0036D31630